MTVALLLAWSIVLPAIAAPHGALTERRTLRVGTTVRSYLLHASPAAAAQPLMIILHGAGGDGAGMQRVTGFDELADRRQFVAVYPDGVAHEWNDGREEYGGADDVGYLRTLIDALVAEGIADPQRVGVVGFSNGGFMAQRVACEAADRVAAIVAVAATIGTPIAPRCAPSRAVRTLTVIGTIDEWVPYRGGLRFEGDRERGPTMSVDGTIAMWRALLGCAAARREALVRPGVTRIDGCPEHPQQLLVDRIEGGRHGWRAETAAVAWAFLTAAG